MSASLSSCSSGWNPQNLLANPLVHPFGERLCQPVGDRLQQDRAVVVVGCLELRDLVLAAEPRGNGEGADVVGQTGVLGRDVVAQRPVRDAVPMLALLAQVVQRGQHLGTGLVGVDLDVVTPPRSPGKNPITPVGGQPLLLDQVSSISWASSYSLRAVSPETGLLRMSGNLPFISQALKNGCQSMYSRSSARS